MILISIQLKLTYIFYLYIDVGIVFVKKKLT